MFEKLLDVFLAGLTLWSDKEKTKYQDRVIEIKTAFREELNKPDGERDDSVLDNLESELRILADSFVAQIGKSGPGNKP